MVTDSTPATGEHGYGTSMHEPHCRDGRCTGCLPSSGRFDEIVRSVERAVAADPDAMRRVSERAFDVGLTLAVDGEAAAVRMLVADGVPEDFAATVVRDIVRQALQR